MIHKTLFIFIICLIPCTVTAQYVVKGSVADSVGDPMPYTSVVLSRNDAIIKGTSTDSSGFFLIDKIYSGSYVLEVSFVGMKKRKIPLEIQSADTNLGTIVLGTGSEKLSAVEITAPKPVRIPLLLPDDDPNDFLVPGRPLESGFVFNFRDYTMDKFNGTWQWTSLDNDSVLTVRMENRRMRSRVVYKDGYTGRTMPGKYIFADRNWLVGWFEFRVRDSVVVSTLNPLIRVRTMNLEVAKKQMQTLLGVLVQTQSYMAQLMLFRNPSKGRRGYLFFQMPDEEQGLAFWNMKVLVEYSYQKPGYALIREPEKDDFVFPTKVMMRRISKK